MSSGIWNGISESFSEIIQAIQEGYVLYDSNGEILDTNDTYCDIMACSRDEVLGANIEDLRYNVPQGFHKKLLENIHQEGQVDFEVEHRVKKSPVIKWKGTAITLDNNGEEIVLEFLKKDEESNEQKEYKIVRQERDSLFENNPFPVFAFDCEGNFTDANQSAIELSGYSYEELLEASYRDFLMVEEEEEKVNRYFQKALDGEPQEFEQKGVDRDDNPLYVKVTFFPIYSNNSTTGVFGIVKDVTDQRKYQQKLEESEQRWHRLVENSPMGVGIAIEGKLEYLNKAGMELINIDEREEALGKPITEFFTGDSAQKVQKRLKKFKRRDKLPSVEYEVVSSDGSIKVIRAHTVKIKYKNKEALLTVLDEITELKKKQAELEQSEKKWKHLIEDSPQPVQVTRKGEIVFINQAGAQLYGAESVDEVIGRTIYDFAPP